jgi:hypothetical protein
MTSSVRILYWLNTSHRHVVALSWARFSVSAVRRRWMHLRPSSDDDAEFPLLAVPTLPSFSALSSRL